MTLCLIGQKYKCLKGKLTILLALFVVLVLLCTIENVNAANQVFKFGYTNDYQEFTAPETGTYKIQAWGAQGGASREDNVISTVRPGGYGAYTAGLIELKKGQKLYVYVGGKGVDGVRSGYATGGYNGGGRGDYDHSDDEAGGAGGGATDIRLVSGAWDDFASLKSRIMVAAGGGGTSWRDGLGYGGDLTSPATDYSASATQTKGNAFGVGQNGVYKYSNKTTAGGGGGYYGGYATPSSAGVTNGSGGSSFISGYDGSDAITEESTSSNIIHTGQSIHYSGLKFDYGLMVRGNGTVKDGNAYSVYLMPNPEGGNFAQGTGKTGNGYAIIEYMEDLTSDDYPNYTIEEGYSFKYAYSGSYQTFTAPAAGKYKLEAWGARGGAGMRNSSLTYHGGYGGYAAGTIHLDKGDKFYVYVGQAGYNGRANCRYCGGYGGWNGGAQGGNDANHDSSPDEGGGGGGATDFRLIATSSATTWNEFESLKSRVIIAGGGAGGTYVTYGLVGGLYLNKTNGYQFGIGQKGYSATSGSGGGGGGYFGGISPQCDGCQGYGGTSYVSGSSDDLAVTEESTSSNIVLGADSVHYSGMTFDNPTKVNGNTSMPNWASLTDATMTGNNNNGYAKVTILELDAGHPQLKSLSVSNGTFKQTFDSNTYSYDVYVDSETTKVTIDGEVLNDDDIVFRGFGEVTLKAGENKVHIGLVNDLGNVTIYSVNIHRPQSSYKYLDDIKIDGKSIENFDPMTLTYTVNIDDTVEKLNLEAVPGRPSQTINGDGEVEINFGLTTKEITVISEDGSNVITYTINFQKSNSSKLKSLKIGEYEISPTFDPEVLKYNVEVSTGTLYVDVDAIPYDKSAKVTITGNGYLAPNKTNKITILVEQANVDSTVYEITVGREDSVEDETYEYNCKKEYQEFIAPGTTYYKIQAWGASGGYGRTNSSLKNRGGYGAYTEGEVHLQKGDKIYIYVGCAGANGASVNKYTGGLGGFNGGAQGGNDSNHDSAPDSGGGGGGATDIRLVASSTTSAWKEFLSLKSRIMVAAGGGGGNYSRIGGAGGTLNGIAGHPSQTLATQTSGYAFGYGMTGGTCTDGSGGAGGGYYGGYSGTGCSHGGGGGSSFVSGCEDCVAITEDSLEDAVVAANSNVHYSNYVFDKITMLSGEESMPSPNGGYQTGNNGNGKVIITGGKDRSSNNFLREITTDKGTISPVFDMQTYTYNVVLDSEDDEIKIGAKLEDDTATLTGVGTFKVPAGTTSFPIVVTAENGDIRTYTVNVEREASSNAKPLDITISGLVPSLCAVNDSFCKLDQEFDPDIHSYNITVPSRIKQLQFTVSKQHYYQQVVGDGIVSLVGGMNMITIEVTSEDGTSTETYTYNINRDMTGNANIENIEVVDPKVDINFDPDITEYYFSIPNEYTKTDLEITLEDEKATFSVSGNENFETGLNIVSITVTAQNNETKLYTLNIYREQSGNVFLKELKATHDGVDYDLNPTFNKIISSYTVNVPYEVDKIALEASAEHELTTISGLGEKNLSTGTNKFSITTLAEDGSTQIYNVSVIRAKSSDASLKELDVLEASIDPKFDKDITEYSLDVAPGVSSLNINAVPNNSSATVKIVGNSGFKVGENIVQIIVTAEDGSTKTYTLKVNRKASDNTKLSMLTTDKYDLTDIFDKDVDTYEITLENDVSAITVSATAEDKLSKVTGTGKYSLKTGDNEINVTVTAENGDTKIYTLKLFRKYNANANLLSISIDQDVVLNPTFDKDQISYQVIVENDIKTLTIVGTPEVKTSTVSGNSTYNLEVGDNLVELLVTAEDGTTKKYEINITRKKSSNCNISSIIAKESVLDPLFNKDITFYELRVLEEVESLNLIVKLEDSNATYSVSGNENFVIGHNTVTITVEAEDGTTKDYVLDVLRQLEGTTSSKLDSLSMKEKSFTPDFSPEIMYYEVTVPYDISVATLEGELDDKNATVTGLGQHNLVVGQNVLAVSVTSTENVVRTYQVVVTREENNEARLSNLSVSGSSLSPIFNKDTYEYEITSSNANLVISATTIDKDATYEILGATNLPVGSSDVIIRVTAKDKITTKDYILHVNRTSSNNNNLKSLEIVDEVYTPEFSKTTTVYYATVPRDVNNIYINALPEDENATVEGTGSIDLDVGVNYHEITVTSESGKTKIYTVIITRTPNDNNYLKSLTTNSGVLSPEFSKTTNTYTMSVPYEIDEIVVDAVAEDETAVVTGTGKYSLDEGENTILVTVTSEAGNTNTYKIIVTRKGIVSSKLKNLEVKNYQLNQTFNQDVYDYLVNVDYEVTSLNLNIETLDKNATYVIEGNHDFVVGMNTITITVTDSEKKTTTIYTVNVNRQSYSNTFLSYISTDVGTLVPNFDKMTLTYSVVVGNDVESIEIFADPEIDSSTVSGTGIYNLKTGDNKIPLTVTSTTGITRTYYVIVTRNLKNDNDLESLQVKVNNELQTLTPEFNKDTLNYEVTVPVGTVSALISGSVSSGATAIGFGNKAVSVGENKYQILVTSESGIVKTYTINLKREASSDNFLTSLVPSVGTLSPAFSYYETNYNLKLDSSSSLLSFETTLSDRFATVEGTGVEVIPDGSSTRKIVVTAEDGTKREYTINVTKDRTDEARLSDLSIKGYSLNETFDKDTFTYTLTVPYEKKALLASEVVAVPIDSNAKVEKTSSITLSSASTNIYTIVVTAADGFTKETYYINVEREKGSEALLSSLKFKEGTLYPTFNSTLMEYTLTLPNTISEITSNDVEAIATDDAATVKKMEKLTMTGKDDYYEVEVESGDKTTTNTYRIKIVYLQSNDATLKDLSVDVGELTPNFESTKYAYTVNVTDKTEEITISGTLNDEKATILSGLGTHQLTEDDMSFEVMVQAEDGTIKVYTIRVLKSITTERLLQNISLSGDCTEDTCPLNPSFEEEKLVYDVEVENEVKNINIDVIKKHSNQVLSFYDGNNTAISNENYELKVGLNEVRIDVKNGIGETTSYYLNITRKKSSNNYLSTLEITNTEVDLEFAKEKQEYFVTIPNDLDKVVVNAVAEVSTSTVKVSGSSYLDIGNNDVYITVTAEDLSTRVYIIHVCRESESNYYLKSLTVSSGVIYATTPNFLKTTFNYVVNVPSDINTVSIEGVPEDKDTIVVGGGEKELKTGVNTFAVTTTSKEGVSANYTIIVNKEKSSKLYLKELSAKEGSFNEVFNKEKFSYTMSVDSNIKNLNLTVVPEDSTATYKVMGNQNFISGKNTILIVLTNSDKTVTTTYKLEVEKSLDDNNYLSSLKVGDNELMSPEKRAFTEFETIVDASTDQIVLSGKTESNTATTSGFGTYSLNYGDNKVKIDVEAEDGSIRTYTVNIKRSYDLDLFTITTDRGEVTPKVSSDVTDYYLEVERDISDITIAAIANGSNVKVEGNGYYELELGENIIEVKVSATDGTYKIYKIHVTRKESSNNYLDNLYVHEGPLDPVFNKDKLEYDVEVPFGTEQLTIDVSLADSTATYEIIGNNNLNTGTNEVQVKVRAEDGTTKIYKLNVLVQDEAAYSNRLTSLTVSSGSLSPDFDPDTTSYTVTVTTATSSINVNGILESVYAKATGLGNHELALGRNELPIVVTSKDGKTRTYSVIVYRIESSDPRLKSLTFAEGTLSPLFDKDIENYTMTVDSSITSLTEKVEPLVLGTTYTISGNKNIQTGVTTVIIESTAGDGVTKKTYTITVTKEQSTNNYLSTLTTNIGTITPDFIKTSTGPYTINVGDDVNSIILEGKAESSLATVTGLGVHQINRGKNTINVSVTSEVGTVRTYTVIVNKSLSNDSSLSFLGISDGELTPEFDKDTLSYTVDVDSDVEEITLLGIATNKYATVSGNGNYNLVAGDNIIPLTVTAEDGSIRTYTINVKKKYNASSKLLDIKAKEGILSPSFDKNTLEYTITVPNEVTSLTLETIKEDENATVKIDNNEKFIVGANQVIITVVATDNTTTIYKLNVIRQTASNNYLKEITLDKGILEPGFNKLTQYYEVEVDSNVDHITITGVSEDINATVSGNGMHMLEKGDNYIYLTVTSASGVERVYTVKVIRKQSNDALLKSLSITSGELTPSFDPMINDYTVSLPEGINKIGISATAESNATIAGTGEFAVSTGDNVYEIIVTAEDGTINKYKITATKASSSNNNIENIIPSSGMLSPNYTNTIDSYEVVVTEDVGVIDFDVITESEFAKVSGDKNNYLDYGENNLTITVEAEDGTQREVYINVIREKNITSIEVDKEKLLMSKGDTENITATIMPDDATNKEIGWETSDSSIATVSGGVVEAVSDGTAYITVYSIKDPNIKKVITVNVLNLQITSEVYEVRRDGEEFPYIIGAEQGDTLATFINNLDNNPSMLHFYSMDGIEFTDLENEKVKTGELIKLEYEGKVYDQLYIAVRGEVTGDGEINVKDYNETAKHILKQIILENYWFSVANVDDEKSGIMNVKDSNKIQNKILGKINSLNS